MCRNSQKERPETRRFAEVKVCDQLRRDCIAALTFRLAREKRGWQAKPARDCGTMAPVYPLRQHSSRRSGQEAAALRERDYFSKYRMWRLASSDSTRTPRERTPSNPSNSGSSPLETMYALWRKRTPLNSNSTKETPLVSARLATP